MEICPTPSPACSGSRLYFCPLCCSCVALQYAMQLQHWGQKYKRDPEQAGGVGQRKTILFLGNNLATIIQKKIPILFRNKISIFSDNHILVSLCFKFCNWLRLIHFWLAPISTSLESLCSNLSEKLLSGSFCHISYLYGPMENDTWHFGVAFGCNLRNPELGIWESEITALWNHGIRRSSITGFKGAAAPFWHISYKVGSSCVKYKIT